MSSTYLQLANECEQIANASTLANVRNQQSNAASAWRIMAERALVVEQNASELAAYKAERLKAAIPIE